MGCRRRLNGRKMNTVGLHFFPPVSLRHHFVSLAWPVWIHTEQRLQTCQSTGLPTIPTNTIHMISFSVSYLILFSFFLLLSISPSHGSLWKLWQLPQHHHFICNPLPITLEDKLANENVPHLLLPNCVTCLACVWGVTTIELTEWEENPVLYV